MIAETESGEIGYKLSYCIRTNLDETRKSTHGASMSEKALQARTVAASQSEMTEIVLPNDTNLLGHLLGGRLMHFIDLTGALAAYRHTRAPVVTASMDHIDFIRPVRLGDILTLKASVNRAFAHSLEVGVKVWAEHTLTGEVAHVASAYLVFVAVDAKGHAQPVPELLAETPDELRRYADALRRREHRESELTRRRQEAAALSASLHGKK